MTILVKQGDSPSSPVYPAEHLLIPQFQGRTGGCLWMLCVDQ